MADFGASEYIAIAGIAASTAVAAYGAYAQGQAQSQADAYNQRVAEEQAAVATDQANAQAALDQENTRRKLGEVTSAEAAADVDVGQGSPLDVLSDQAAQGELQRQTDLYKGKIGALGFQSQSQLDAFEGASAATAGAIGGGATLLGGVAKGGQIAMDGPSTKAPSLAVPGNANGETIDLSQYQGY